ncbi:TFIIB-type zinc ribbon-containing protein [Geomonas sp. RF6]|uniref:TFIIB-type zinc ribbon-containing protein n=1 Tax=Geomonas sp. RF6 TaxID=2897342 RepID=UPI001E63A28F|nr:TFIIB-type zinc ribbon-containing protein [Geomonas sp. RF6]UFS70216.1 TFIIB-type zinc ribbon-containing protein [Geomonas sp. RF6]
MERIFSGSLFVFASGIDLLSARRHKTSLDQTGIVCHIEPVTPIPQKVPESQLPAPVREEPSSCPKCGAPYNGEAVCGSCGVVPAKYLERQRVEQEARQAEAIPTGRTTAAKNIFLVAAIVVLGAALLSASFLLPKGFKYDVWDWADRLKSPNFEHPLNSFAGQTQNDLIREYQERGFTLHCYGNLRPDERVSKSEDYACWFPIKSAYNNIPARYVTFFFSGGILSHARLEFPDSSFAQVQDYLQKKLGTERRLDMLPQHRVRTDIYGVPVMVWEVNGGWIQTASKATPGRTVMVLWTRKGAGDAQQD